MSVSQWWHLPAFSASSSLCCRSFPCLTEHWTELESENEPQRKRKRLSLRRKENKPITGDGGRRVGAPSGSLFFGCSERRFRISMLSLERRLASLSVSVLRPYQPLKPLPLNNAMHGDDWIVQTNLLAIDIGRVVRFGSSCEAFALFGAILSYSGYSHHSLVFRPNHRGYCHLHTLC